MSRSPRASACTASTPPTPSGRTRDRAGGGAPVVGRAAAARAAVPALPPRAVGWAAPARADRRRARDGARSCSSPTSRSPPSTRRSAARSWRCCCKLRETLGLGVLVVTHDLGLAWNIADRIAVMYLGRVVEAGPTEEVLRDPQHPYTRALLSVVPEIDQLEPVVLVGEMPDPTRIPAGCRFHPRCPALADGTADGRRRRRRAAGRTALDVAARGARGTTPPATSSAAGGRSGRDGSAGRAAPRDVRRPGRVGRERERVLYALVVLRRPGRRPRARRARAARGRGRRG